MGMYMLIMPDGEFVFNEGRVYVYIFPAETIDRDDEPGPAPPADRGDGRFIGVRPQLGNIGKLTGCAEHRHVLQTDGGTL